MNTDQLVPLVGSCAALVTSIVAPSLIVGRYLGGILTKQEAHQRSIDRLEASHQDQGTRLAHLEGALQYAHRPL